MSGSRGRREERAGKSGLGFRVSALGVKDDDGRPPYKNRQKRGEIEKGTGSPHSRD